jgi:hypothetical protein
MRSILCAMFMAIATQYAISQQNILGEIDLSEVRYFQSKTYDLTQQQILRERNEWQSFLSTQGSWFVHFDEYSGLPHKAYGQPFEVPGSTNSDKAIYFAEDILSMWQIPVGQLHEQPSSGKGKYEWINFRQEYEGLKVIGSRYFVKFYQGKVVQFGCDVYPDIAINSSPNLSSQEASAAAVSGLSNPVIQVIPSSQLLILPVPEGHHYSYHLCYEINVKTRSLDGIPANYQTLVDAHSGEILSRQNTVKHTSGKPGKPRKPEQQMMQVQVNLTGDVYENNPYESIVSQGLPNNYITVGGQDYALDENGTGEIPVTPGSTATIRLQGPWSRIYRNGTTPQMTAVLQDGVNNLSFNNNSIIRERSAYRSVQRIHDFMKTWMPDFESMDYQLTTNIDETGTCNAFYDGSSINFYNIGGGCNATSLISDVCFHEYGHGINDFFYQDYSGFFQNGAMGEGYADFWAIACTGSPLLGIGFYTENQDPLRRYDQDPKVYPDDLSGEVHNDGEIIMGAWWDTHLLMGADWNITMPLFVETYSGLQAEAANGNEGVAYTDVLVDLLQSDDDDGDISNGTPHGDAIIQGFYIHGITLISNASLNHTPILSANAETAITLNATLSLQFPFTQYLSDVYCFYKVNGEAWNTVSMDNTAGSNYTFSTAGLPPSSVLSYYFGAHDINGSLSAVNPVAAQQQPNANLPFTILVGVEEYGKHDCDSFNDFGSWQFGVPDDNATTGEWIEDPPQGSYIEDTGDVVQPNQQHTPGGEFCFLTGNAPSANSPVGENDVDGGKTTLQSPMMDLSSLTQPVIAYWRYYTNSPPSGANPGQDYWQVRISNDGGANWVYVENTTTSDMSWRRNAFRIADYVTPTATMKMQFIASDSTIVGANLDGGSLVEALVDDFVVYDELIISVDENKPTTLSVKTYPTPARETVTMEIKSTQPDDVQIIITDKIGKIVRQFRQQLHTGEQNFQIDISALSSGTYDITIQGKQNYATGKIVVKR